MPRGIRAAGRAFSASEFLENRWRGASDMRVGTVLFVLLLTGAAVAGPHGPRFFGSRKPVSPKADTPVVAAAAADAFRTTVRPILATRCAPCHNPGGRMYARFPFDDPQVVSSHSPGVLRRLKADDRATLEKWLAGLAPAAPER
jgi:hypothetical protein